MDENNLTSKLSDDDKQKLTELLGLLRSKAPEDEGVNFLCTHCHCRVCTSADKRKK